ncbi:hypothetical protein EPN28_01930 [Patescibacteria group bacterium]|nr:MAG: hypothetical protein EPN28_01930 [Patescibacteria group bacterium]
MPDEQSPVDFQKHLSRHQKIGLLLLSIFALLAVGLGYLQLRNTMLAPFALNSKIPPFQAHDTISIETLRFRDTDKDGLNDFDELYIYQTSPYLADSDSDGASDKQEIDKGANPNCAEGKDCSLMSAGEALPAAPAALGAEPPATSTALLDINKALSDPKQLREMLTAAGMDKDILDKISDNDLLATVQEIMNSTTSAAASMLKQ